MHCFVKPASSQHKEDYIWACKHLFGLFSIVGALQIIAMPNGFFNDSYKAFAVYFLGAKNTSFFYYAVFLYFVFYDDISKYRRIRKRSIAFVGLFVVAALKCDSMNTLMMMIIILGFIIVINYAQILRRLIKPPIIIAAIIVIAVVILVPEARMILGPALDLIGRDTSFTGRDVLWLQVIQDFKMHPLLGNGILTEYRLATGVMQDNAHSQFLDLLAKYGLMVFLPFVMMPVVAFVRAIHQDRKNTKMVAIKGAICFMILFHSIVDHMMMYHYILLMVPLELLSTGNSKTKTTHSKRHRWIKAL